MKLNWAQYSTVQYDLHYSIHDMRVRSYGDVHNKAFRCAVYGDSSLNAFTVVC